MKQTERVQEYERLKRTADEIEQEWDREIRRQRAEDAYARESGRRQRQIGPREDRPDYTT